LQTSLTVLLPVYNAVDRLVDQVERLLEILPELSHQFEIVIIDDGSTDDTPEMAGEIVTSFPQVSMVRHPVRLGLEESIQTGLDVSQGEVVFVGDQHHGILSDDLEKLWKAHSDEDYVLARRANSQAASPRWLSKVMARAQQRQTSAPPSGLGSVQMIRRSPATTAPAAAGPPISLRVDGSKPAAAPAGRKARPNYLDKMKRTTLGE
jgi:glycosyltransferase involved in cell wall biosynthesis